MPGALEKCLTGIDGLDSLTYGGLPKNRSTLVVGGPGCGKTVMSMEFLIHGAHTYDEPGVLITLEENEEKLITNFSSMGHDLKSLVDQGKILIDSLSIIPSSINEAGEFNLEPLFLRLEYLIKKAGAKRVVIDTIEALHTVIDHEVMLRAEIRRLIDWLSHQNVTSIITAELHNGGLTKSRLEEYVSDCVILLDHRISQQVSKRRIRILKYRGSYHSGDECPFMIGEEGVSVLPLTNLSLDHKVSSEFISTGIDDLDEMLQGKGFFEGSSVLVSGTAGTGKSSLAAYFVTSVCEKKLKALYYSYEESSHQIERNMKSIGMDLHKYIENDLLVINAERSSSLGLEEHLLNFMNAVKKHKPDAIVLDPITNFFSVGDQLEIKGMLTRIIDFLKKENITVLFTSLSLPNTSLELTTAGVSSLMDTWIILKDYDIENKKRRLLYLIKSRGMEHSRDFKELFITSQGIKLKAPDFTVANFSD